MYFSFWQEHLDEFLGLLRKQGYHPKTIAAHKRFALSLVTHEDQVGWHSYEDARTYISGMERLTDKARWFKLSIINKLEDYHLYGILPVHRIEKNHTPVVMPSQSIGELNLFPMNEQIDDFSAFFMQQGKSDATAMLNGLKPYNYLTYVMGQMKDLGPFPEKEAMLELLPWSPSLPADCHSKLKK